MVTCKYISSSLLHLDLLIDIKGISGTGSLRVGTAFLSKWFPGNKTVYLPKPSWGNHTPIVKHAGMEVGGYRYIYIYSGS